MHNLINFYSFLGKDQNYMLFYCFIYFQTFIMFFLNNISKVLHLNREIKE